LFLPHMVMALVAMALASMSGAQSISARAAVWRRTLKLKAKFESVSSHLSFNRWNQAL